MDPSGSEKTEGSSKRRKGNEASRVPSMSLPEGGGAIGGMGEKFAANPVTGIGSMTAHNRGYVPNLVRHLYFENWRGLLEFMLRCLKISIPEGAV